MPKRTDIKRILVIGSGPIVIGQACEFDYSGAQACKVLREEGYRVILVNSNPATIMTDPELADATYVELSPDSMAQIRQAYGQALCVDDAFWQAKAECSFATLISIGHLFVFPPFSLAFRNRRSWVDLGTFTGQSTSAGGHLEAHCSP